MIASAMEITCGRYICQAGACAYLGKELKLLSAKKVYILAGRRALEAVLPRIEQSLKDEEIAYATGIFEGYCTYDNAKKHVERMNALGCDCIVGVGGGKCMDTAKAMSKISGRSLGNIPTQLATCVACTNMAIMYENSGAFLEPLYPDKPIVFVLADLDVLVKAPERYIASGIADSMAKYPELHFSQRGTANCAELDDAALQTAHGMAISTWNILKENGRKAYADCAEHLLSNEFSAVANTNLITTGIISGLARGSKQLAIAHSVYNNSTTVFPETWRSFLHGEIVSVGILLQEYYNNAPADEITQYIRLAKELKVPVCFRDIGIEGTADELDRLHAAVIREFTDFTAEDAKKLREDMERVILI